MKKNLPCIAYVGTYPPRECGIATFTKDLTNAIDKKFNPQLKSRILAVNDNGSSLYNYKKKVISQIDETDIESYIDAAKYLNKSKNIQLVNIQHEFGIFGGEYGDCIIPFLETLKKPVVTTFHSVLPNPDPRRKKVVQAIVKRSTAITVMVKSAIDILKKDYDLDTKKINVIPHGVPTVPFKPSCNIKKSLGLKNKIILSTFGLIESGKGIEYIIKALPQIIKKNPNVLYLIIGETHPQVRKREGEKYRNKLRKYAEKLGLKKHVKFYNKYLNLREIIKYLLATDIYISVALNKDQISSGTLAYAVGCGKAVISTPYLYAKEVLANNRGILVNFKDSRSITNAVNKILSDPKLRENLEKRAYKYGQHMTWPNVAVKYLKIFNRVVKLREEVTTKYPKIKLKHIQNLTDDTGIIQHTKHSISDRKTGYTSDDNARALIVALDHYQLFKKNLSLRLINTYLSFLNYVQKRNGKFHNYVGYTREFLDKEGSEDSFGRVLWTCGYTISNNIYPNIKATAKHIFDKALKHIANLTHLRAKAFTLIGLYYYHKAYPKKKNIIENIKFLADSLVKMYKKESSNDWEWFENSLTYSNGKLPESLFLAYDATKNEKYLQVAKEALDFLSDLIFINNKMVLIGSNGWYNQGGKRAIYDQQPVDAASMVHAYLAAYKITKKEDYYKKTVLAFNWFLGKNSLNQTIYDEVTGGCFDGLMPKGLNLNQGAESTISYLLARLSLEKIKKS